MIALIAVIVILSAALYWVVASKQAALPAPVRDFVTDVGSRLRISPLVENNITNENLEPAPPTSSRAAFARLSASGINRTGLLARQTIVPSNLGKNIKADLKVCGIGSSCSGDVGSAFWAQEATINNQDLKRGLTWSVDSKEVDSGLLQISNAPFGSGWPVEAFYTQNVALGTFVFDFNSVVFSQTAPKPIRRTISIIGAKPANPSYYIRVVPIKNGQVIGAPTNEVNVKLVPPPDDSQLKLYSPPKIYSIKIKQFTPLLSPDKGVCSHAMILETDYMFGNTLKKAGDRICPAPYKGIGEKIWYEQLWDAMSSGVAWVSNAYNDLKSAVVDAVGSVACGGDSDCKKLLSAGLDIGLTALGVPPSIPNFDQLVDGGFDYLASEMSSAAGCPDAVCKDLVKKSLSQALEKKKNVNPGCMDAAQAHDMGIEPVCLPNGVKAHWDPAATYRDANAVLEVTRNMLDAPKQANSSYRILISSQAKNSQVVGGKIINIEPYNKTLEIKEPLSGEMFQYKTMPLPLLEKGQKITIPIYFAAKEYWVPGHKELMGGWSTVTYKDGWPQYQYDDWWLFYYGADLTLDAKIDGCQYYGGINCNISEDIKNYAIQY